MKKLAFCLALFSCLALHSLAFAQMYSVGAPPAPGTTPAFQVGSRAHLIQPAQQHQQQPGGGQAQTLPAPAMVGSGCGVNGGYVGSGCGVDGGFVGSGCGVNGGYVGSGCGVDGGCGTGCGGCGIGCGIGRGGCGPRFGLNGLRGRRPFVNRRGSFGNLLRGGCTYLTADIGWAFMDSKAESIINNMAQPPLFDYDNDVVGRVGIGKQFGNWRLESELGYRDHKIEDFTQVGRDFLYLDGRRKSTTGMFNIYRDFNPCGQFRPYFKGGFGLSYNEFGGQLTGYPANIAVPPMVNNFAVGNSTEFAWSIGCGLGIQMTQRAYLDLEYQFMDLGGTASGPVANTAIGSGDGLTHEFTMGLRWNL